jgi:hypothetical protein
MIEFLLSIIASLLAACLFLLLRNTFGPNIAISDYICHGSDFGAPCFLIKVINLRKRKILNLKCELIKAKVLQKQEGQTEHTSVISLKRNELVELGPFLNSWKEYPDHIWRFVTFQNLPELLKDDNNCYLKFIISGHDSISGKCKTFVKRYTLDDIKEGTFYVDNRLSIKNDNLTLNSDG